MCKRQDRVAFQMVPEEIHKDAKEYEMKCKGHLKDGTHIKIQERAKTYNNAIGPFRAFGCRAMIEQAGEKSGKNRPFEKQAKVLFARQRFKEQDMN